MIESPLPYVSHKTAPFGAPDHMGVGTKRRFEHKHDKAQEGA